MNDLGINPDLTNIYLAALASAGRVTPVGSGGTPRTTGGKTGSKTDTAAARTGVTNFNFDEDEGIITWNGHSYNSLKMLESDLSTALARGNITKQEEKEIKRKLAGYGINING